MTDIKETPIIDATQIPKEQKSPRIFIDAFDALAVGKSFIIHNDHDPKPLKSIFDHQMAGQFAWEYLLEGPDLWRIMITRIAAEAVKATAPSVSREINDSCGH